MTNTIALETLKKDSVRIYPGIVAVFPQFNQEESLNLTELAPKFNGRYAVNNSTVCYVTADGEIFVTPYTRSALSTLCNAGFSRREFYVPFSNGDYPKAEQYQWKTLREKARKSYEEDFFSDCNKFCDEHNIGYISEESLKNCFQMPMSGVRVKHLYFENCYYPVITSTCLDCVAIDRIGKFCTNNGRVVFVYRDGKTYVTKGYKILSELRAAGYREAALFVPFSNGEEIVDPVLKASWDRISK